MMFQHLNALSATVKNNTRGKEMVAMIRNRKQAAATHLQIISAR